MDIDEIKRHMKEAGPMYEVKALGVPTPLDLARRDMRTWAEDVKVLREQCGYKDSEQAQEALKLVMSRFRSAVTVYTKAVEETVYEEHLR